MKIASSSPRSSLLSSYNPLSHFVLKILRFLAMPLSPVILSDILSIFFVSLLLLSCFAKSIYFSSTLTDFVRSSIGSACSSNAADSYRIIVAGINTALPMMFLKCVRRFPNIARYLQAFHLSRNVTGEWSARSCIISSAITSTSSCVVACTSSVARFSGI